MEQTEKKIYPSQINSKTISARIPVADYVNFMQDALNKGISMNDWLLIKIYGNADTIISGNNDNVITIEREEILNSGGLRAVEFWNETLKEFGESWPIIVDKEQAILQLVSVQRKQDYIDFLNKPRIASVDDIKTQLAILIKERFDSIKDRNNFRREIYNLLKELEETE